ncbi:hypothetical protein [Paenibacillus polymyxa]|uniref:hypothetical protein n=1 Tax=Paenibacillus polymyxa TaxID=1406 RepID=UPI00111891C1|nr:hypothetical protein [Paenibacillus polymyxa]QDA30241.1 hypothetical protein FGY93_25325 [Paenibacillus polymyxa]
MASTKAPKSRQLYYTRHDHDLKNAIDAIPHGSQNHEIRKALRYWFLGEGAPNNHPQVTPTPINKDVSHTEDIRSALNAVSLPEEFLR